MNLLETGLGVWAGFIWLKLGPVARSYEHDNEFIA
jgi:hypothetical protein